MICRIADLITYVPTEGSLASLCQAYTTNSLKQPDITIDPSKYICDRYARISTRDDIEYMESASQFYSQLLRFQGMHLHASAVELNGKAYLFSARSGTGKSTHTRLWQQNHGPAAQIFNDDKPALRIIEGTWYAYGTPWCGKDHINQNKKVELAGICFLKQADHNNIRRLSEEEAVQKIMSQTFHRFTKIETVDIMLDLIEQLVQKIPVFELENRPEPEAAWMSYYAMTDAKKEN